MARSMLTLNTINKRINLRGIKLISWNGLTRKKGTFQCLKNRSHRWTVTVGGVLYHKSGCPFCSNQKRRKFASLSDLNQNLCHYNIKIVKWHGFMSKPAKCQCLKNKSHFWTVRNLYHVVRHESGCPICARQHNNRSCHALTLTAINKRLHPYNIKMIHWHHDVSKKGAFQCLNNKSHIWAATVSNILYKHTGCPICRHLKWIQDQIHHSNIHQLNKKLVKRNVKIIKILNKSRGYSSDVIAKCLKNPKHPHWKTRLYDLINNGTGCPTCNHERKGIIYNTDLINKILRPRKIVMLSKFDSRVDTISSKKTFGCLRHKDHKPWTTYVNDVLSGTGCPECNESFGEDSAKLILEKLGYTYLGNAYNHFNLKHKVANTPKSFVHSYHIHYYNHLLSYDFVINVNGHLHALEIDGLQHVHPIDLFGGTTQFKRQKKHDHLKNKWCLSHFHNHVIRDLNTYSEIGRKRYLNYLKKHLVNQL